VFLVYHLGVVFLNVRNASDLVTQPLLRLAEGDRAMYVGITCAIGIVFAAVFWLIGRGETFRPRKLVQIVLEGVVYAIAMGAGTQYIVGRIFAGRAPDGGPFAGLVMSMGAGFYEELAFRVVLFGVGAKLLVWVFAHQRVGVVATAPTRFSLRSVAIMVAWALVVAGAFSGMHYVGAYGDPFAMRSFVARAILGLALTLIYVTRGFAAAVWAHALYDVWVLVL
jgi:hypothetical protein